MRPRDGVAVWRQQRERRERASRNGKNTAFTSLAGASRLAPGASPLRHGRITGTTTRDFRAGTMKVDCSVFPAGDRSDNEFPWLFITTGGGIMIP